MSALPLIMGIDPGVTGGIAMYAPSNPRAVAAFDIPLAGNEVDVDAVAALVRQYAPDLAVIERAGSMPGQGVSSTFKFGAAYGALRASVVALGIPLHVVAPGVWKRHWQAVRGQGAGTGPRDPALARRRSLQPQEGPRSG